MMRVAKEIAPLYPELNLDLLLTGILFHDSGKLWENALPENGFVMSYDELGELMGHISIGLELVNALWRRLSIENAEAWKNFTPASEDVRMHLLHLIAAHHGEPALVRPSHRKRPRQWRFITLTIWMRVWKCSPQVTPQPNRSPRASLIACGHCRGIW
jgi:3'-5' exoribonuclease